MPVMKAQFLFASRAPWRADAIAGSPVRAKKRTPQRRVRTGWFQNQNYQFYANCMPRRTVAARVWKPVLNTLPVILTEPCQSPGKMVFFRNARSILAS
jgi:hypothetical protein